MTWNEELPEWDEPGARPPAGKITGGWEPEEKPPAGWFNWLFNRAYECLAELRETLEGNAGQVLIAQGAGNAPEWQNSSEIPTIASIISHATDTQPLSNTHTRQLSASSVSRASGFKSQVNASFDCIASGQESQVNASTSCEATGYRSQVNASNLGFAYGDCSQTNVSEVSATTGGNAQVNASRCTINADSWSVAGGYATMGDVSTANRKWHIFSETGNIQIAGTLTSSHTFTDYAEFFPNLTGSEIPIGTPLVVDVGGADGYGVRPVQPGDVIEGVVSETAAIRLGDTPFTWAKRFVQDEWGRPIIEEIEVYEDTSERVKDGDKGKSKERATKQILTQRENPVYNPDIKNVPRSDRKTEWTLMGMLGQVYMRISPDAEPGDYLKGGEGIAIVSENKTNVKLLKIIGEETGYNIGFCLLR